MAAEIPDGAVLVARAILNSSLWTMRPEDCKLAISCICIANWKNNKIWFDKKELTIERGQFVRSLKQLCEASRMNLMQVRTSLNHLILTGFLTRRLTGQSYVYTIPKYDRYQDLTKYSDLEWQQPNKVSRKVANKSLTRHQQGPNNKQEGEEGEEGKEGGGRGKEPPPLKASPGTVDGLVGSIVKEYRKADRKIPEKNCREHVQRAIRFGAKPQELLAKVVEFRETMKLWKICDLLTDVPKKAPSKKDIRCLTCGDSKKVAGGTEKGKITLAPCPRCG